MATDAAKRLPAGLRDWRTVQPWITTLARVVLAAVLGYAGWAKVTEPLPIQRQAVKAYQILPEGLGNTVGVGLPILELAIAALLLVGFATRFAGGAAALLMIVFIGGIISVWARGLSIDCGCFGGGGQVASGQTKYLQEILRDSGFLVLAAWIAVLPKSRLAADQALGLYSD